MASFTPSKPSSSGKQVDEKEIGKKEVEVEERFGGKVEAGNDDKIGEDLALVRQENEQSDTQITEHNRTTESTSESIPRNAKGKRTSWVLEISSSSRSHFTGDDIVALPMPPSNKKIRIACDFHAKGWCIRGNSCSFLHSDGRLDALSGQVAASSSDSIPPQQSGDGHKSDSHGALGRQCLSSNDWTPSAPFHPSHIITRELLIKENLYDLLHNIHQMKFKATNMKEEEGPKDNVVGFQAKDSLHLGSNALKYFEAALIQHIKELLEPTWARGRISRDNYKAIVKRSVEKVMNSLSPNQIPGSSESAKMYITSSRSKLQKLVQGYLDKYRISTGNAAAAAADGGR